MFKSFRQVLRNRSNLALMLAKGAGRAPDIPRAYMWLSLAAEQGDAFAKDKLDYLVSKASSRQVAEGQRLAAEWKRNHGLK